MTPISNMASSMARTTVMAQIIAQVNKAVSTTTTDNTLKSLTFFYINFNINLPIPSASIQQFYQTQAWLPSKDLLPINIQAIKSKVRVEGTILWSSRSLFHQEVITPGMHILLSTVREGW